VNRRELGLGCAVAWPVAARTQPRERTRRLGFLWSAFAAEDPEGQARGNAFVQGLQELGWGVGRNLKIDYRWGLGDTDRLRIAAQELVALAPDILFAAGGPALAALERASSSLPIVFTNVPDPIGTGFVSGMARPGGNATGFMNIEYGQAGKWLELLKQVAPNVTRVAVLRGADSLGGVSQFASIQAIAPLVKVEVVPIRADIGSDIERGVTNFAHDNPNGGLIVPFGTLQRDLIVGLAARHRLPAVYFARNFVTAGGLICYGPDIIDLYRRSAAYVDRILKGEKPSRNHA
jgi:ABC-type uncharacterized transport system substrate-binding protein